MNLFSLLSPKSKPTRWEDFNALGHSLLLKSFVCVMGNALSWMSRAFQIHWTLKMTHPCEGLTHLVLRKRLPLTGCILAILLSLGGSEERREAFCYFSFGTRPLVRGLMLTMFDEFVKCKEMKQKMLFGRQTFQIISFK